MNKYIAALPAIRPPFLTLAPLSCLVGLAYCAYQGITIDMFDALLSVLGAILAAIAVNTINEYQDFQNLLDLFLNLLILILHKKLQLELILS